MAQPTKIDEGEVLEFLSSLFAEDLLLDLHGLHGSDQTIVECIAQTAPKTKNRNR